MSFSPAQQEDRGISVSESKEATAEHQAWLQKKISKILLGATIQMKSLSTIFMVEKNKREQLVVRLLSGFVFILLLFRLSKPFRSTVSWMEYVQDDFYYYLKVAQNIAHGHGSTFNGIVPTNGYHPLWEALFVGVSLFSSRWQVILAAQAVLIYGATAATFVLSMHLFRVQKVRLLTGCALSLWVALYSLRIFIQGMEVTLTIPLVFGVICVALETEFWLTGFRQSFLVGLLAAAAVLSRLDSIILVALIGAGLLSHSEVRSRLRRPQLAGLALGLMPLVLYLAFNEVYFHTLLPVSGMAKQLKAGWSPSLNPWRIMNLNSPAYLLVFLPIPFALLVFPWAAKYLTRTQRVVYGAVLIFPLVYFSILSFRSDWPSWGWYLYSLRTGECVSLLLFCSWPPLGKFLQGTLVTSALLCVFLFGWVVWKWPAQTPELYAASRDIAEFSRLHPGVYAMGDRSGSAGYLMGNPLIQTEGLMMDRHYLDELRSGRSLREVLGHYHARYYIGSSKVPLEGCFQAIEPSQAGPASPHLLDQFCGQPLATFVHDGRYTFIYDLAE